MLFAKIGFFLFSIFVGNKETMGITIPGANAASSRENATKTVAENVDSLLLSSEGTGLSSVSDKQSIKTVSLKITTRIILAGISRTNEIITSASLRNKSAGF